ncbi:MAG: NAD(P)H-dependent oxidoreductase subunit E [Beijerinckiaceae bacterium]|nr:NAD(P)H-dependent oxidoreductase subunit E [Beijerinckiaceae bacterium]
MPAYRPWNAETASAIINELKSMPGATLPIFHALQNEFGFVHPDIIPEIADALNISRAEVHGTLTFYHDFRTELPGRRILKICRAEACQSVGCEDIVSHLEAAHRISMGTTTDDRRLTVETIYCLGNCALGPSIMLDGEVIGRADTDLIDDICHSRRNERIGAEA